MARPISFRWGEGFVAQIDKARGAIPRSAYVRQAIMEKMLSDQVIGTAAARGWHGFPVRTDERVPPGEVRLEVHSVSDALALAAAQKHSLRARSSQQAKADVQPRQKGK